MVSQEKQNTIQGLMLAVGLLLMMAVVVMRLLNITWQHDKWLFAFGAVLTLAERLTEQYHGDNMRLRVLYRMGKISAVLYCVAAYFMFTPTGTLRDSLAFLIAGVVMQLYCTFAYDHEQKKHPNNK